MSHWEKSHRPFAGVGAGVLLGVASACSPQLDLATWACKRAVASADAGSNDGMYFDDEWSTGFENGVCDYFTGNGSCYTSGSASYRIVDAPVHGGHYAAAFTVIADSDAHTRCHRDGVLPVQATYGAWYYIPALASNSGNWNLIHFQGGNGRGGDLHNLWDVSLVNNASGGLRLSVLDLIPNSTAPALVNQPAVPIRTWFHIEVFWKRASDATGKFTVSQDGIPILQATDLITDDTPYGQWYVGNLATNLNPAESTLYVDDVTVRAEP